MEELIWEVSERTIKELKKAQKAPYPLYYANIFNLLLKENNKEEKKVNPKLLCDLNNKLNEQFIEKTADTLKEVSNVSKEIKKESSHLKEEIKEPIDMDCLKDIIIQFSSELIDKVSKLENTVQSLEKELQKSYKEMLIDPLTKVYNRKALEKDLAKILPHGKDKSMNMCVAALDFDHFKEINDNYGHLVGDFVLIKIISTITQLIRKEDRVYRYGGDEFIIVFNRSDLRDAEFAIKRITSRVAKNKLKYKEHLIDVTLSIGLTMHKKGDSFESIIKRADEALYEAKKNRNCYVIK